MNFTRAFCRSLVAAWLLPNLLWAGGRTIQDFDGGWRFSKGDPASAMLPAFADDDWQSVTLPHDWSSDGPFTTGYGSGNGYAPGGIGWYRKHFSPGQSAAGKTVTLEFDGVYDHSEVWINGQFAGGRPYGYSSFQCDLTPFIRDGDNVVAVRVDHSRFADSRYYTGSGIYRNVRLVVADPLHIAHWGVAITTPKITPGSAAIRVATTIENLSSTNHASTLETSLLAPDGTVVASASKSLRTASAQEVVQKLTVRQPRLWDVETPVLYQAVSKIMAGGTVVDEVTNTFGIREFHFDPDKGFFLNGKNLKLKGVCLHHDAGAIGAAVPDKVLERRLLTLKEIGANAIRTSHNPPDPALLDFCDRLGFLVMDEAFDEFTPGKNKWVTGRNDGVPSHYGYNELFAEWSVTDIQDLVRRDRNHPGIILWSIGNEVDYANDPFSDPALGHDYRPDNPRAEQLVACARPLIAAVKALDPTRPVTAALATVSMSDAAGLAQALDVDGYNYQEWRYPEDHRQHPRRIIYGSENGHGFEAWEAVRTNDFIAGQFLWTGADYLGEADAWPHRASGPGLLDLCGFKKPLGWYRQSLWSREPMVHLCVSGGPNGRRGYGGTESWNWQTDERVTVFCYANCPEVTLLVNGKTAGVRKLSEAEHGVLRWEIFYEPGTLLAVGRQDGREVCRDSLQTAGPAARIELRPDAAELRADGKDVCHLEFRVVDARGVRVPEARPEVTFDWSGPGKILGLGNADLRSVENCKTNTHAAFQGRGLALVQSTPTAGEIVVQAASPGLEPARVVLHSK